MSPADFEPNMRQIFRRVYDAIRNCLRVCVVNDSSSPVPVEFNVPTTPLITKVTSPAIANDEFSHTFQSGAKYFMIRPKTNSRWAYSYVSAGESVPMAIGAPLERSNIKIDASDTIYIKCPNSSREFVVEEWS